MVCCEVRMWVLGCGSDIYLPSVWQTLFVNFPGKCKMLATLKHWLGGREGGYNTITVHTCGLKNATFSFWLVKHY